MLVSLGLLLVFVLVGLVDYLPWALACFVYFVLNTII